MAEALQCYTAAVDAAERASERAIVAESLRRSGIVHHRRSQPILARQMCERSQKIAVDLGDPVLAAEALNALAGFDLESGSMHSAREKFQEALQLGGSSAHLRGRTEQNLGILATLGLGLVGSVIGGLIASFLGTGSIWELNILGFVLAVVASVLLIGVAESVTGRKQINA